MGLNIVNVETREGCGNRWSAGDDGESAGSTDRRRKIVIDGQRRGRAGAAHEKSGFVGGLAARPARGDHAKYFNNQPGAGTIGALRERPGVNGGLIGERPG